MADYPFDLYRGEAGIALLCLAVSAICVYLPCRWNYRPLSPPSDVPVRGYLPYLYLVFYATVPVQLLKNYTYYQYILHHGGYVYFFVNHAAVASSVPFFVRAIVLISYPAFMAIFVFERRTKRLYVTTGVYFAVAAPTLLMGSRGGIFLLVLTLWYIAAVKSTKKSRILRVAALIFTLILVGDIIQSVREDTRFTLSHYTFAPIEFIRLQGNSLDVTEVAVKFRNVFAPYSGPYLWNELTNAFVANDTSNYYRGKSLAFDVAVLLSKRGFIFGHGTGGSYVGEAYIIGGLAAVAFISLLIGSGLHYIFRLSSNARSLFVVALILPDIIGMPRGQLLDWLSVLIRSAISILILGFGLLCYRTVVWLNLPALGNPLAQKVSLK